MSIRLEIEPYCDNCDEFQPEVNKNAAYNDLTDDLMYCDTIITCKHANMCRSIKRYLDKGRKSND